MILRNVTRNGHLGAFHTNDGTIFVNCVSDYPVATATGTSSLCRSSANLSTMSFTIQKTSPATVVVRIGKALDFRNAVDFKASCQEHTRAGVRHFVLDFTGTGILDSTGLGVIFSLYRQLTPIGGQVVFASVSRPVQVVVQLTRTYKVFRQFPTVEDAFENLERSSAGRPTGTA